jgi:hypothetical protein
MKFSILLLVNLFCFLIAQGKFQVSKSISVGTGYSIIKYNRNHATQLQKFLPIQTELFYFFTNQREKSRKKYFMLGITFLMQRYAFHSYYFYPDSLRIYDKTFPVTYRLNALVLGLNLGFKHEFNNSEKYSLTPYIWMSHTLFSPVFYELKFKIDQKMKSESDVAFYRYPFIGRYINPGGQLSFGLQNNMLGKKPIKLFLEVGILASSGGFLLEKTFLASRMYFNYKILFLKTGMLF